jgi:starvation-inducible DNA-binding protein
MLQQVMNDFIQVDSEIKETIKVAQSLEDEVTVDLLIGITASLQKHIWFINASLK